MECIVRESICQVSVHIHYCACGIFSITNLQIFHRLHGSYEALKGGTTCEALEGKFLLKSDEASIRQS